MAIDSDVIPLMIPVLSVFISSFLNATAMRAGTRVSICIMTRGSARVARTILFLKTLKQWPCRRRTRRRYSAKMMTLN